MTNKPKAVASVPEIPSAKKPVTKAGKPGWVKWGPAKPGKVLKSPAKTVKRTK